MVLNDAGQMEKKWYPELENNFQNIRCNEYIIMPNHSHVIITNIDKTPVGADLRVCPD
jgi:REP-associated tyrosine transposase